MMFFCFTKDKELILGDPRSPDTRPTLLQVLLSCSLRPSLHAAHGQAAPTKRTTKASPRATFPRPMQKITPIKLAPS